jgi:hypothetical protein
VCGVIQESGESAAVVARFSVATEAGDKKEGYCCQRAGEEEPHASAFPHGLILPVLRFGINGELGTCG